MAICHCFYFALFYCSERFRTDSISTFNGNKEWWSLKTINCNSRHWHDFHWFPCIICTNIHQMTNYTKINCTSFVDERNNFRTISLGNQNQNQNQNRNETRARHSQNKNIFRCGEFCEQCQWAKTLIPLDESIMPLEIGLSVNVWLLSAITEHFNHICHWANKQPWI